MAGSKVRVGVILMDESNRLLLVRQNDKPFWVLPGGTLEPGESMGDCAIREIKEEVNLDIILGPMVYIGDFFAGEKHVVDVVFFGHIEGGQLQQETTENINEIGFFTQTEVASMEIKPQAIFEDMLTYWSAKVFDQGVYVGAYS